MLVVVIFIFLNSWRSGRASKYFKLNTLKKIKIKKKKNRQDRLDSEIWVRTEKKNHTQQNDFLGLRGFSIDK